jgi:hypothetical protein
MLASIPDCNLKCVLLTFRTAISSVWHWLPSFLQASLIGNLLGDVSSRIGLAPFFSASFEDDSQIFLPQAVDVLVIL